MDSSISFSQFDNTNTRRVNKVKDFLTSVKLELSPDIEVYVSAKEENKMIACGGLSGNILKCIAISPEKRGEGLFLSLMTQLINAANDRSRKKLFVYSTPNNISYFEKCGFLMIEKCDNKIILMENSKNLEQYKTDQLFKIAYKTNKNNPFTKDRTSYKEPEVRAGPKNYIS